MLLPFSRFFPDSGNPGVLSPMVALYYHPFDNCEVVFSMNGQFPFKRGVKNDQ